MRAVPVLVALLVLNAVLTFDNVWPTLWVRPTTALSVELAVAVAAIAWAAQRGARLTRRGIAVLAALFTLLALTRYAEVTALALFGRPINLYWDAEHLPRVAAMLASAGAGWLPVVALIAAVVVVAAVYATLRWAFARLAGAVDRPALRSALGAAAVLLAGTYAAGLASDQAAADEWFAAPVGAAYVRQFTLLREAFAANDAPLAPDAVPSRMPVDALGGADVLIVFVESYGAATFERPEQVEALASVRAALADSVARTGRVAVSAYVESPTFGGGSWLAHATLLSGIATRDANAYNRLMNGRRTTLVEAFARAGYRTVALMPGLRQAWPEGGFYGFDAIYDASRLDYRGPPFGWWRIPDQYALAKLDAEEFAPAVRPPVFAFFPTITSHAPFRPTPPYAPDWEAVLAGTAYRSAAARAALATEPDWMNLAPAYAGAVSYALETLAGYLERARDRDLVLVVLGDHQPPGGVAGQDPSWRVPVHVIASRPRVLRTLVAHGFTAGLEPRTPAVGAMHDLTGILVAAFGSGGGEAPVAQSGVDVARPAIAGQPPQHLAHPVRF